MSAEISSAEVKSVGVIGLGFMGSAMSANIVKEGFSVIGYDIVKERMALLEENGGQPAFSCRDVAEKSQVIITSLPSLSNRNKYITPFGFQAR